VGRYTLRYEGIDGREDGHVSILHAVIGVFVGGERIATMEPEKRFYKKPKQPTTEIANRSTLREDLYLVLGSYDPDSKRITLLAYVNPLVVWIWIGGSSWRSARRWRCGRRRASGRRASACRPARGCRPSDRGRPHRRSRARGGARRPRAAARAGGRVRRRPPRARGGRAAVAGRRRGVR